MWYSPDVFVEKMFLTASSLVVRSRVARSLQYPSGQLNRLKLPDRPLVEHSESEREESHFLHWARNGRPYRQIEVNSETVRLRTSLCIFPFLREIKPCYTLRKWKPTLFGFHFVCQRCIFRSFTFSGFCRESYKQAVHNPTSEFWVPKTQDVFTL